jgi:hypothetical protein
LPDPSTARTSNVCRPWARFVYTAGEVQVAYAAPSSEHSNVAPAGSDENVNVAVEFAVGSAGPKSIVVSGAAGISVASANGERLRTSPQT